MRGDQFEHLCIAVSGTPAHLLLLALVAVTSQKNSAIISR
jgi:hypothetical protein